MSDDTPSTIRFGSLTCDAHEPEPLAVDPLAAEVAELRAMVVRLLEYHQASLQREQARLKLRAARALARAREDGAQTPVVH